MSGGDSSTSQSRTQTVGDMRTTSTSSAPLSPLSETSSAGDDFRRQASARPPLPASYDQLRSSALYRRTRRLSRSLGSSDGRQANSDTASFASSARADAVASGGSSSSSSQGVFNPEAAEFVPGVKMPPKRKASSSARPSKAVLMTPRNSGSYLAASDQPIIRSEEVFGRDSLDHLASDDAAVGRTIIGNDDDDSDFFHVPLGDQLNIFHDGQDAQVRGRLHDALTLIRSRVSLDSDNAQRLSRCSSAILFTCDQTSSVGNGSSVSSRLRYLPLQPASDRRELLAKENSLTIVPSHRRRIDAVSMAATSGKSIWPHNELPVELFEVITDYLSRDDVKSMRLVCKEFEKKVSRALFNTAVVPFNTELYDMIDEDTKVVTRVARANSRYKGKGKGRAQDHPDQLDTLPGGLHWQNAKEDAEGKVYKGHGLRVFQGFGPHIRKFGMSFEVAEGQLARTPAKKELDHVESYFGSYDWPPHQYTRFAGLAGLERTADDTMRMKSAFANLKKVQELALSIDSGLGWLDGPDKSLRAQIFDRPSTVFGSSWAVPDRQMQEARDFWSTVNSSTVPGRLPFLMAKALPQLQAPADLSGLKDTRYADSGTWSAIATEKVLPSNGTETSLEELGRGVIYTTSVNPDSAGPLRIPTYDKYALIPSELKKEQKEWLLETEWAQRAFLECYMLAILDNPTIFNNITTLKLAKISSGFLPLLARFTFWNALPSLVDVTVLVKPDWRSVERDDAGYAEVCNQNPSEAARLFYGIILRDRVCLRPSITKLNIGWVGGGEQAEGMFARNAHILPAPIMPLECSDGRHVNGSLVFNFVEHLTLTNCWLTPPAIEVLIENHSGKALKKLTLESVSLTADPRSTVNGQAAPPAGLVQMPPAPGIVQAQQAGWLNLANQIQNGQPQLLQQGQHPQPVHFHFAALQNLQAHPPQAGWGIPPGFANAIQGQAANAVQVPVINPQQVAQAQHQMFQQLHLNGFAPVPPAAGIPNQPGFVNQQAQPAFHFPHWSDGHREGSWPEVLNTISCGPIFTDYLRQPAPWEKQLPEREGTNLQTIEFKSCGYVKLIHNTSFDQTAITSGRAEAAGLPAFFRERHAALLPAMMSATDRYMGRIMQFMPQRELDALLLAWGMTEGWTDRAKAEEAEYDGMARGGTGRFSGRIDKCMALIAASTEPAA